MKIRIALPKDHWLGRIEPVEFDLLTPEADRVLRALEAVAGVAKDQGVTPLCYFSLSPDLLEMIKEELAEALTQRGVKKAEVDRLLQEVQDWRWIKLAGEELVLFNYPHPQAL